MANITTETQDILTQIRGEDVRDAFDDAALKICAEKLPDVTEQDAGKYLQVNSNGQWVATAWGELESITVLSQPTKTSFYTGDTLDFSGLVIAARFSSGYVYNVTAACTMNPARNSVIWDSGTITVNVSYTDEGITKTTSFTISVEQTLVIAPFATARDGEIKKMIESARLGEIDLYDDCGWRIGDTRRIDISAYTFTGGVEYSVPAQQMDIVISSFDDYNSCGSIMTFDFKDCMSVGARMTNGGVYNTTYGSSHVYSQALPALANALPAYLSDLLLTFDVNCKGSMVSGNKLALRSFTEYYGTNIEWIPHSPAKYDEGEQIPWYGLDENAILKGKGLNGSSCWAWTRSQSYDTAEKYVITKDYGDDKAYSSSEEYYAPFGCL